MTTLSRPEAAAAVESTGWRVLLATLAASVRVPSLRSASALALAAVDACGADADRHLRVDARADRVDLVLQSVDAGPAITERDVELARAVSAVVAEHGYELAPTSGPDRPVQQLEIAIDTMDLSTIKPFWEAVLGYRAGAADDEIVDPARQGPTIWFQQMDEPRTQRNRIHFDITVAADEAPRRVQAALDAGGRLVSDAEARAFWILADADGNEVCVCTWQDRD
jgi:4a-hydroxytetrahydrobiopterin dehydratase